MFLRSREMPNLIQNLERILELILGFRDYIDKWLG